MPWAILCDDAKIGWQAIRYAIVSATASEKHFDKADEPIYNYCCRNSNAPDNANDIMKIQAQKHAHSMRGWATKAPPFHPHVSVLFVCVFVCVGLLLLLLFWGLNYQSYKRQLVSNSRIP